MTALLTRVPFDALGRRAFAVRDEITDLMAAAHYNGGVLTAHQWAYLKRLAYEYTEIAAEINARLDGAA